MLIVPGFKRNISENLTVHIAEEEEEINEIIKLNIAVHGEDLENPMKNLFKEHPNKKIILWIYVKDIKLNKIVSTGILLPEILNFEGIKIPICEMGFVATLESYRNKGLFQKVNDLYEEVMEEYGYIISAIRGIPYYYRRFNYEFSIPFNNPFIISPSKIPDTELHNIKIYKATIDKLGLLESLYNEWVKDYNITLDYSKDAFTYRFLSKVSNEFRFKSFIVEEDGKIYGFFSIGTFFGEKDVITFSSKLTKDQIIKVLQYLRTKREKSSSEKNQNHVLTILTPENSDFGKIIRSFGGKMDSAWKWQILIPNIGKFLKKIKPILEKRINNSLFKNLTLDFRLSNYRETFILKFKKGNIFNILNEKGYPEPNICDLRVPYSFINKIILGDCSIEEMHYIIQDALFKPESLPIINVLFPKKDSYLLSYY
ncbi:MAG: GNAT family N-acetyltransferase [Candidatus Lokiarchaeota archaeon]